MTGDDPRLILANFFRDRAVALETDGKFIEAGDAYGQAARLFYLAAGLSEPEARERRIRKTREFLAQRRFWREGGINT